MKNAINSFFRDLKNHRRAMFISGAAFFAAVLLVSAPLFGQAMRTFESIRIQAIQEKNAQIETAIINNDYDTWNNLVTDKALKKQITRENFAQFSQSYQLLQEGKIEELNLAKKSLALKQDFQQTAEKSKAIDKAIKSRDYDLWASLVTDPKSKKEVTRENFKTYASAYELILQGKIGKADLLKRKINLKTPEPDWSSSR